MKRGEVRWYKFARPDKNRPVVVLTRDSAIDYLSEITVAPVTTTIRDIPTEIFLSRDRDHVPQDCVVNLDHIQTVSKTKIGALLTVLDRSRMAELRAALLFALGF